MTQARDGAVLYTPDLLGLAVTLADFPIDSSLSLRGEARSRTCGSTVSLACAVAGNGAIERIGLRATACAVGQASAAIFALGAVGRDRAAIARARGEIHAWISGADDVPDWPDIEKLDAARAYPARHGAIPLAWDAALDALSKAEGCR